MELKPNLSQEQLEQGHNYLEQLIAFWEQLVAGVPPEQLPQDAYIGCTLAALVLWFFVARVLPKPLGVISWSGLFALLCTPTVTGRVTPTLAPACIGFIYGIATKNSMIYLNNAMAILSVYFVLLILAFLWYRIRAAGIERYLAKQAKKRAEAAQEAARQAALAAQGLQQRQHEWAGATTGGSGVVVAGGGQATPSQDSRNTQFKLFNRFKTFNKKNTKSKQSADSNNKNHTVSNQSKTPTKKANIVKPTVQKPNAQNTNPQTATKDTSADAENKSFTRK